MTPSYSELLFKSWDDIKGQMPLVAGLSLVYMVGLAAVSMIPFIGSLFSAPFTAGYLFCLMKLRKQEVIGFEDLFWGFLNLNRLIHLSLLSVVIGVGIVVGLILLVIPGIWFAIASSLATSVIVLKPEMDAMGALRQSLNLAKGRWWWVFGLCLLMGILALLGFLVFVIGVLVSLPVGMLVLLNAVEILSQQMEAPTTKITTDSILTVNPS